MYVVGYPKSGNTWFCYLLSYCLNAEFDDYDVPGVYPINESIRKCVNGKLKHKSYQGHLGKILKTHWLKPLHKTNEPIIYLVRDGRDVMVSYYHYEYGYKLSKKLIKKGLPLRKLFHRLRWRIYAKFF